MAKWPTLGKGKGRKGLCRQCETIITDLQAGVEGLTLFLDSSDAAAGLACSLLLSRD